MRRIEALFTPTVTGTEVQKVTPVFSTDAASLRSSSVILQALSSISVRASANATVEIISNPFGDAGLDKVVHTFTNTSGDFTIPCAGVYLVSITNNAGTVYAAAIPNEEGCD